MGGQVQRKVKRRNEGAGANGNPFPNPLIAACTRADVQRLDFARHPHGFFGRNPERVDQSAHFTAGVINRLSSLNAQSISQFIFALDETIDAMLQNIATFIAGHARHRLRSLNGRRNSRVDHLCIRKRNPGRHFTRKLVCDRKVGIGLKSLIRQVKRVGVPKLHHSRPYDQSLRLFC